VCVCVSRRLAHPRASTSAVSVTLCRLAAQEPLLPRFYPCTPWSALRWFAPFQPRLDHALFYEAMGERFGDILGVLLRLKVGRDSRGELIYRLCYALLRPRSAGAGHVAQLLTDRPWVFEPAAVQVTAACCHLSPPS
jgi:hypothetical protein